MHIPTTRLTKAGGLFDFHMYESEDAFNAGDRNTSRRGSAMLFLTGLRVGDYHPDREPDEIELAAAGIDPEPSLPWQPLAVALTFALLVGGCAIFFS